MLFLRSRSLAGRSSSGYGVPERFHGPVLMEDSFGQIWFAGFGFTFSIRLAMDPSDLCLIHSTRSSWTGECTKCCFSACEARAVSSSVRKDLADFPCSHWQHSVECMILNGYQSRLQMSHTKRTCLFMTGL